MVLHLAQQRCEGNVAHAEVAVEKARALLGPGRVGVHALDAQVGPEHAHFAVLALHGLQLPLHVLGLFLDLVVGSEEAPLGPRQVVAHGRGKKRLLHERGHLAGIVLQELKARARVEVRRLAAVVGGDGRAVRADVLWLPQQPPRVRRKRDDERPGQLHGARGGKRHDRRARARHQTRAVQVDVGHVTRALQGPYKALQQRLDLPLCGVEVRGAGFVVIVVLLFVLLVQGHPLQRRHRVVFAHGHFRHDTRAALTGVLRASRAEQADIAGVVQRGVGGRHPGQRLRGAVHAYIRQHRPAWVGVLVHDGAMRDAGNRDVLRALVCQHRVGRVHDIAVVERQALLHAHLQVTTVLAQRGGRGEVVVDFDFAAFLLLASRALDDKVSRQLGPQTPCLVVFSRGKQRGQLGILGWHGVVFAVVAHIEAPALVFHKHQLPCARCFLCLRLRFRHSAARAAGVGPRRAPADDHALDMVRPVREALAAQIYTLIVLREVRGVPVGVVNVVLPGPGAMVQHCNHVAIGLGTEHRQVVVIRDLDTLEVQRNGVQCLHRLLTIKLKLQVVQRHTRHDFV